MKKGLSVLLFAFFWTFTQAMAIFVPTDEWQPIPEDVAIPGGLEVKMDIENGGRWARLMQGSNESGLSTELAPVTLTHSDLDNLEEKSHDYDDGAEIARLHGISLFQIFKNPNDPDHDQAGRILSICVRNNNDATRALITVCPDLPRTLGLDKRSLSILSALVSTKEGLQFIKSHGTLEAIRREVGSVTAPIDENSSKAIVKLLQDLAIAGEDGDDMCDWVDALQQAYYVTKNPELRQVAIDIVKHNGDFETLTVYCTPQPGLLSKQEEKKRAVESARRFANPMATRNHFDEL